MSEEQQKTLDNPITVNEIIDVIQQLPNGKAPGLDGFRAEFFKLYVNEVSPLLLDMYTESLRVGSLPPTLNEALITSILKKDKDATECKSYRPTSLIGQDRKILAKILANRLDKIITHRINPDQVGFIRSWNFFR